jgi:hypothetical protein
MRAVVVALLLGLVATAAAHAKQYSSFRAHAEANASNGPVFSNQLNLFGRTVTLEKIPTVSEQDVIGFRPYQARDGSFGVLFELDEHGRLALDTLSIDRRGGSLFIFANGRSITELRIDRRVSDGKIYIPSGFTAKDIELFKKDWPPRKRK